MCEFFLLLTTLHDDILNCHVSLRQDVSVEDNSVQRARVKDMSVNDLSDFLGVELDVPAIYCEVLEGKFEEFLFSACI